MIRITMLMLCLVLAAAAAGRYQAEVDVRETRTELRRLEQAKRSEINEIKLLRAEIAYLESPERLSKIAAQMTELEPMAGDQLLTAGDFIVAFGDLAATAQSAPKTPGIPSTGHEDDIVRAVAVADLGAVR